MVTVSSLNVRLPHYLHAQLRKLAQREGVSMNQFITLAVAEKIAALETRDYLHARGERVNQGNRDDYRAVLATVPDVPADERDAIPADLRDVFVTEVADES